MKYYAHSNGSNKAEWELLTDHLKNVSDKTAGFCNVFGFSELGFNAGYLHDIGKYQESFQKRIEGKNIQVEHSICGAKELINILSEPNDIINRQILSYVIAGHHSGLPDCGTEDDISQKQTLLARLKRKTEDYSAYKHEFTKKKIPFWLKNFCYVNATDKPFAFSLLVRMLFSALVDADSLETERFYNNGVPRSVLTVDFEKLREKLNEKYNSFNKKTEDINIRRTEIKNFCEKAANSKSGLFSLTVPTGGGKTLSSMTFAINHLIRNNHSRIIYVIPYTAIIDQTAKEFKNIFGESSILEHHSSVVLEESMHEETPKHLATENWDAPIVLTTNVQFFDSLFSNKRGKCRKIHNVANSIIVFDEAQMLPIPYLKPCLRAIDVLTRDFGCTALLMSATCPDFKQYMHIDSIITEINNDYSRHYKDMKRVTGKWIDKKTDAEIIGLIDHRKSNLIIVNSRKHAGLLFKSLPQATRKYHLSTLMTPENRKRVLNNIKNDLESNIPCTVVSTPLIECGVDLDFEAVFRSLSGIDSIIQAGGRCNREGKRSNSNVYIFEAIEGDPYKGDIPIYKNISRAICKKALENNDDIFELKYIEEYFQELLEYKDKDIDEQGILELFQFSSDNNKMPLLKFDFEECAKRFSYISDANKKDVIIPYNVKANNLIQEINNSSFISDLRMLHRKLEQYTVSVYSWEHRYLNENHKLINLGDSDKKSILTDMGLYSDELGLQVSGIRESDPLAYIL